MPNSTSQHSAHNFKDRTGQRFGRLIAVRPLKKNASGKMMWLCRCDCGSEKIISSGNLITGETISCGCAKDGSYNRTHGCTSGGNVTSEYTIWAGMLTRCTNHKRRDFKYYGGRGITVCERWRKFENFLADMGNRPDGLTLDRINNDGNYEPNNCRWATWSDQAKNRCSPK